MFDETVTIICEDGLEREFQLILIFDHKEMTYGILRQKLHGHWEINDEIFLVDDHEEKGAENNFFVMQIINPDDDDKPFEFECVHPDLDEEITAKASEVLDGNDYYEDDDCIPF